MGVIADGVPLRERQRQERETLILRAAEELFLERGYHDTSIEDIAARVGIAKGTVYLHFASKEDLVLALLERGIHAFAGALDAILTSHRTPRSKVEAIVEQTYGSMLGGRAQLFTTVFRNPELMARMQEKRNLMHELWEQPMRRLTALLDEGKAAGEFDPSIPTPLMLTLLWSLLTPHGMQRLANEQIPASEITRHVCRFFFKGVAAEADAPVSHGPGASSQHGRESARDASRHAQQSEEGSMS
jgi:TetR/AcrR family fatty acid metabolism transcriptional regulator